MIQVVERSYCAEKVPRGEKAVYDIHLDDHERIVGVKHSWTKDLSRRETVDHYIVVWVEVQL